MFETDIEVLTTDTVDNKRKTVVTLTNGIIHRIGIFFPPGCANVVKITLNRGIHQIFPTNPDGYIKGDGLSVEGKMFQPILTPPYEVYIEGWGVNAGYKHEITIRLWMLKVWQLMPFSDELFNLSLKESVGSI